MKKAKTTLANLSGLSALRLAREPGEPAMPAMPMPTKTEEAPPTDRRVRSREVEPTETARTVPVPPVSRPIEQSRPVGRPRTGKRSNEDYRNVTVYIRKDTHADTDEILRRRRRKGMIAEGEPSDVSELVQLLLAEWLDSQGSK